MSLPAGTRFGPYEILSPLGAGGMGEVYKARDTRLDRDVALKVLPPDRGDARRFAQEARAVAALNHPNIVAIYDVGENYIVTELVEGSSLRGQSFPLRKTLELAAQVADGLSAAHAAGFAHRDLKPENIMVTRDGRAKILDFGLAKPLSTRDDGDSTRTMDGIIMGTVGYMSPEQVKGQAADSRSDIFSFGVVLYEMLAARQAFAASSSAEVMAAILKEDPPELPASVPAGVRDVVRHCLEKDPAQRFQSAKDLGFALSALAGTGDSQAVAAVPAKKSRVAALLAAGAAVLLLSGMTLGIFLADQPTVDVSHLKFTPMAVEGFSDGASWSASGRSFVYVGGESGVPSLLMARSLDAPLANRIGIPMPHGQNAAVFSKDGSRVYYTATSDGLHRELWTASLAGGTPERLFADLGGFVFMDGLAITPDGKSLVLAREEPKGKTTLWISTLPGPPLEKVRYPVFDGTVGRAWLRFSPDGKQFLAVYTAGNQAVRFWLSPWPANGSIRELFPGSQGAFLSSADWMPDSRHLLIVLRRDAINMDASLLMGDTRTGRIYPIGMGQQTYSAPAVSAQGKVLLSTLRFEQYIVELPLDGSAPRNLVTTERTEDYPDWSPSGDQLAFVTNRNGPEEIWLKSGSGDWERPLVTQEMFPNRPVHFFAPVFSPDGQRIAFSIGGTWIVPAAGGAPSHATVPKSGIGGAPSWSPDGQWLSGLMRESGRTFLVKFRVGSASPPFRIHEAATEFRPMWSPDGNWITILLPEGLGLVSPDGQKTKLLLPRLPGVLAAMGWSRDGRSLYLADRVESHIILSSIDVASGHEKQIADYGVTDFTFGNLLSRSAMLSVSHDGRSLAAGIMRPRSEIWMLEGLEPPRNFWQRMFQR